MKRLVPLVLLSIGYLAGYASGPRASTAAQTQAAQAQPQGRGQQAPLAHPTKSIYWPVETLKKGHADAVARAAAGQTGRGGGAPSPVMVRTPNLSMSLNHRRHLGKPQLSAQKIMSMWDDAESHEGNYDFYVIVGGSGTVVVDGPMENSVRINAPNLPGEFRGQPITNGISYKVKEGDWLLIPPDAPHWPQPDPGGMTYLRMVIYTTPR